MRDLDSFPYTTHVRHYLASYMYMNMAGHHC